MNLQKPAIFAHRGASLSAPENTLTSFRLALEQRANGIELDVHLTADQEVVVIHDADLSRTTNGQGLVHEHSLSELKQLDAGQGESIPTLEEVFKLIGNQLIINIELKSFTRSTKHLPERVLDLVQHYGLLDNVILSSFDPKLLSHSKHLNPQVRIGLLYPSGTPWQLLKGIFTPLLKPYSLHPHFSAVTSHLLYLAKKRNRRVFAWTVNQPEDMKRLFELGIDGIITDDPQTAYQVRESLS